MTTRPAPGIYVLGDAVVNFYALVEGADVTLVDSGLPSHYRRLEAQLEQIGRSVRDVRAIVLTHAHIDHLGLAERVRGEAGATVWAHPLEAPALADPLKRSGDAAPEGSLPKHLLRRPAAVRVPLHLARSGAFRAPRVLETSPLRPGAILDVPGRPHIVAVPGHTPGSIALHLTAPGAVLTGDALVTEDAIVGRTGPSIVSAAFSRNTAQAAASLDALAVIDADLLLPGHGLPLRGAIRDAVDQAREAAPSRTDRGKRGNASVRDPARRQQAL
jgi:glyoxylase-like metal-dependent hydrolase (beta-lactamase superfamily II)